MPDMPRLAMPAALAGLLFLVAASTSMNAHAADEQGNFALRGFGAQQCSAATKSLEGDTQATGAAIAWLLGYSTAFNRMQSGTFDVSPLADATSLYRMVMGICQRSPDSRVETVAFDILRTLAAARVTVSTPIVETKSGEVTAEVRQETLLSMQTQLIKLKYLTGTADGVFGAQTEAALKAFQKAQELPVTGVADAATIVRLLVELPAKNQ
jgi:Putative peptidoglycan binding domain